MSKQIQLRHLDSLPIRWLSEGRLRNSILLRQAMTATPQEALKLLLDEATPRGRHGKDYSDVVELSNELLLAASADYLRCIAAKSIAEVFKKVTSKYRNEAARKQFFKRLVQIAEAVHLSESNARLDDVIRPSKSDDVMVWVNAEAERLLNQQVDLGPEFNAKLSALRVEFKSYMRQLEDLIGITWPESERYSGSLTITSYFLPGIAENESTWRWGCQWFEELGILNINPPIVFLDAFRKGVLAREAAILLSPRILDMMEHAPRVLCEQAEYLAYRLFDRKNDKEFWAEARHGPRQKTRFRGHELIDFFLYYEMMVGDSLYRELWSRLREFGNVRLSVSDYYIIFNTLAARPVNPRFDRSEQQLLILLSKRPEVAPGEAARLLRVSIPTAMKAIRDLSRKAGLRFTIIADMQKLGLAEYLVLLKTTRQTEVLKVFSRFPYCRQVFRTYGSYDLFCVVDVPQENSNFMSQFLTKMTDKQMLADFRLAQLKRDFQSVNFDHYDVTKGQWDIHWDSWGLELRERVSRGHQNQMVINPNSQGKRFAFDKLDLHILSSLQIDCRTPFSAIGRTLGVSGAYVGKKIVRMMREGVFRYAVWPLKIGAEDWGVIGLSTSSQTAGTLAEFLSWLPAWRGGLVTGDIDGLIAIVWSPSGELKQFFKAIDDRLIRNGYAQTECLSSVGEWVVARWLPVDPDDPWNLSTDDGRWLFEESRFISLVD